MDLLNPWMLCGLTGLAIPVLVHLLSRRRQDIVEWGAMQFLEPSLKERRSLWIENFWLLLLRMGLVGLLALALARPWVQTSSFGGWFSARPQDVALIVDGSYSVDRQIAGENAGDRVRRMARAVIDQLDSSDTLQIYDARDTTQPQLPGYVHDLTLARESLLDLPAPAGTSNLAAAIATAARDLLQTGNLDREIVVITDGQRFPWHADDAAAWQIIDQLKTRARIPPRISVLTVGEPTVPARNLSLGRLEVSRQLALPGTRITLKAEIRSTGYPDPQTVPVELEINGVRSPAQATTVRVPVEGTTLIEMDVLLDRPASHALTFRIDPADDLAADNRCSAVVEIGGGWPVQLVDGTSSEDPTRRETFFARAAFDSGVEGWLRPVEVPFRDWKISELNRYSVVVLANVPELSEEQVVALQQFVMQGGAVLVSLGDQSQASNRETPSPWDRWLPVILESAVEPPADAAQRSTIDSDSLELPWQERFRRQRTIGFGEIRYGKWWKTKPRASTESAVQVVARFQGKDPALVWERRGQGMVAVWTTSLDADWNALPTQADFVAWWHEVLFSMLEPAMRRNIAVGEPLLVQYSALEEAIPGQFASLTERLGPGVAWTSGARKGWRWPAARGPGLYGFLPDRPVDPQSPNPARVDLRQALPQGLRDVFAVHTDPGESDLTPLSLADRDLLAGGRSWQWVEKPEDLERAWQEQDSRSELAPLLLYVLLGFLVLEVWMTRRMVHRGSSNYSE